jgi:hypothetical protein
MPLLIFVAGLAALAASQAFLPSAQAGAGPCRVPSTGYLTIQAAVNDATCATINVAAGTYTECVTIARNVTIHGAGQGSTVVDGGRNGTVVTIAFGATVTIRGVTIQRGAPSSTPCGGNANGGGISNAGTLTVENSIISGNNAEIRGGGIASRGSLTVQNSTISGNVVGTSGGGIWNGGTVTLEDVTFENNIPNDCTGCPGLL